MELNVDSNRTDDYGWACFDPYSSTMCARHVVISLLGAATLCACIYKLYFFHHRKEQLHWYQFVIFYAAAIETLLLLIHWMLVRNTGMLFAALIFQILQGITLVFFYGSMATRQVHKELLMKRFIVPLLVVDIIYLVATMIYAWVTLQRDELECRNSAWIQFSVGELFLATLFVIAGVIVTRTILSIQMEKGVRNGLLLNFWGLAVALLISAIQSTIVDSLALADRSTSCMEIFGEKDSASQFVLYLIIRVLHYLLPIWAMLVVFKIPDRPPEDEPLLSASYQQFDQPTSSVQDYSSSPLPSPTSDFPRHLI